MIDVELPVLRDYRLPVQIETPQALLAVFGLLARKHALTGECFDDAGEIGGGEVFGRICAWPFFPVWSLGCLVVVHGAVTHRVGVDELREPVSCRSLLVREEGVRVTSDYPKENRRRRWRRWRRWMRLPRRPH
ncbi:hypothetical protein [Rhodococcus sp. ACPA1]|uniref:hypothetical protein n=1 Tax=Rhodococcus sp. ACPA1 TaxID=2028572 RepID=UPI001C528B03|nr:hypothetical protein [Rhodococcus sp. ACPA1]